VAPMGTTPHALPHQLVNGAQHRPRHVGLDVWRRSHGRHTDMCGAAPKGATQKV
jgi:hypothetical protein